VVRSRAAKIVQRKLFIMILQCPGPKADTQPPALNRLQFVSNGVPEPLKKFDDSEERAFGPILKPFSHADYVIDGETAPFVELDNLGVVSANLQIDLRTS
jgi:hypothetical protein